MRIGVTSRNLLKVNATKKAYAFLDFPIEVLGYDADSGVGEQPVNDQALIGARNRILDLKKRVFDLDRIVSIESGIFSVGDQWLDKAVIVLFNTRTGQEAVGYSEAVIFPTEYVEKARQIGFETMTVGQVMAEAGYVTDRRDPHLSLSGISRQVYIESALQSLVEQVERA